VRRGLGADRGERICGRTGGGRDQGSAKVWDLLLQEELHGEDGAGDLVEGKIKWCFQNMNIAKNSIVLYNDGR